MPTLYNGCCGGHVGKGKVTKEGEEEKLFRRLAGRRQLFNCGVLAVQLNNRKMLASVTTVL